MDTRRSAVSKHHDDGAISRSLKRPLACLTLAVFALFLIAPPRTVLEAARDVIEQIGVRGDRTVGRGGMGVVYAPSNWPSDVTSL